MTAHHEEPESHGRFSPEDSPPFVVTVLVLTLSETDFGAVMRDCHALLDAFAPTDFEVTADPDGGHRVRLVRHDGYEPRSEDGRQACLRIASERLGALGVAAHDHPASTGADGVARLCEPLRERADLLPSSTVDHELAVHDPGWPGTPEDIDIEEILDDFDDPAEEFEEVVATPVSATRRNRNDCRLLLRVETTGCDGHEAHEQANRLAGLLSRFWWGEIVTVRLDKPAVLDNGRVRVDVELWRIQHTPEAAAFELMELLHGGTWTRPVHLDDDGETRVTATWYGADPTATGTTRIELWCQATTAR
ncbi:hypothetical protein [Actinopolyspora mortivallis]|uniref:Uncharacterized protein n=1 Tax=Actinopolyspora mortivallis TaxID=33906 RepID=A0A2T0GXV8_ACTMO|nr:hypothetical protein [Actinopolyspora mortivallis]PRW63941.1 hypothetical protein CEP50_08215 [Actinopolyspora mortivallis]